MATHSAGAAAAPYRTAAEMDEDEASMLITGMFRRRAARKRILMMASAVYEKAYDESTGCFFYYNKRTQTSVWDKPKVRGAARCGRTCMCSMSSLTCGHTVRGVGIGGRGHRADTPIQGSSSSQRHGKSRVITQCWRGKGPFNRRERWRS